MLRLVLIAVIIYLVLRLLLKSLRERFVSSFDSRRPGTSGSERVEETEYEVIESKVNDDPPG